MRKCPEFPDRIREGITEMKKKASMILAMVLTAACMLTGCANGSKLDGTQTAATLDDAVYMELGEVSLMLRYEEAQMQTYYGSMFGTNIYQQDMGDGSLYGDVAKDTLMDTFEQMYVLEAEAANFGVALTEEEKAAITETAEAFMAANTDSAKKAMGVSQANVERVLTLMTLENKMYDVLTADVDTVVSDEEAAQKRISYVFVSTTASEEEDEETKKEEAKTTAQAILEEAQTSGDLAAAAEAQELSASEITYGADSTSLTEEVRSAADALAEGEFSDIVETETGYYVIQMISTFDEDATETKKESIVTERKNTLFDEEYAKLAEGHTFTVEEEVLEQLTFDRPYTLKLSSE